MDQDDVTEALAKLKPKKPPAKQWRVDRHLTEIEQKMEEDGATLADIHSAAFSDVSYAYFKVLMHRARKKRDRRSGGRETASRRSVSARGENESRGEPGGLKAERKATRFGRE